MRTGRDGRETSFVLSLYGFWFVQAGEVDCRGDCEIGRASVALPVGNVEAGFADVE